MIPSCTTTKRVVYSEMTKHPTVQVIDNSEIIVQTENSGINSSLFISRIKYSIDTVKKEIYLIGYQSIWKFHNNTFELKIKKHGQYQLDTFNYYWIDPDNMITKIDKLK